MSIWHRLKQWAALAPPDDGLCTAERAFLNTREWGYSDNRQYKEWTDTYKCRLAWSHKGDHDFQRVLL